MKIVDAMGDACPIPVVKTKKAIEALETSDIVQTLVDNEIAVQNLTKMAQQKNFPVQWYRILQKRCEMHFGKQKFALKVLFCNS